MIDREITSCLTSLFRQYPFVTVTGPRQSGKTTLCRAAFPELAYVNLERPDIREFAQTDPNRFLAQFGEGAILDEVQRVPELLSWLFWQMGSAPYLGGGFGHFYAYAPEKWEYPIDRYAMETKRQLDVLNRRLSDNRFLTGADYTIADIAVWAWYGQLVLGRLYSAGEFLGVEGYGHVRRWAAEIDSRPAVRRGRMVNRTFGDPETQLHERHDAEDFGTKTRDRLEGAD